MTLEFSNPNLSAHDQILPDDMKGEGSIRISGFDYPITIAAGKIAIGCEVHTTEEWTAFTDTDLLTMGAAKASRFWTNNRDTVLTIAATLSKPNLA